MSRRRDLPVAALALLSLAAGSACAAPSCPGDALGMGIHVDATDWATSGLDTASVTGTICLGDVCKPVAATSSTRPADLFLYIGLPNGPVAVRVRLTTATGRTVDVSTTATVQQVKLQGSGCGSTPEIDLKVSKAGALLPGEPRKLG